MNWFFNFSDIIVRFFSQNKTVQLEFDQNYLPYQVFEQQKFDIDIELISGLPNLPPDYKPLYKAKNEGKNNELAYYWEIIESESEKILISSDTGNSKYPFLALRFSFSTNHWKIYYNPDYYRKPVIDPFVYPLGSLLLYYLTVRFKSLFIHGSAVVYNGKAFVFSGVSGVGKSTMAKLWKEYGATIINDDRLIIRKINNKYIVYNTPMYYPDVPRKNRLEAIFLISHGSSNQLAKLNKVTAIGKIAANCIHHNYHQQLINQQFAFIEDLASNLHIFDLKFVPDTSVVDYILNYYAC